MTTTIVISAITFFLLTLSVILFPHIRVKNVKLGVYWMIALLGAVVLLIAKCVSWTDISSVLTAKGDVNPLKILVLFFSMTFISVYLDEVGLFSFLAQKAASLAKTKQLSFFATSYFLTALLTVFTSNDVVILTLTPFLCFFCKNTKINPVPYLVGEFVAANTWSMALLIGNPTNVYLATSAGVAFWDYFKVMALPTLAAGAVEFLLLVLIFGKSLKKELEYTPMKAEIKSKPDLIIGVTVLVAVLVFLAVSGYVDLPMWLISAVGAGALLVLSLFVRIFQKGGFAFLGGAVKRLPYQLVPFALSMFVIVVALEKNGVSSLIGSFLGEKACVFTYGFSSYLADNLINNIPMSILFSSVAKTLQGKAYLQAVYGAIVGSNVGAFLTPIGALAGIMFTDLTAKYNARFSFKQFIFYGFILSVPTLAAALGVLYFLL